MKLKEFVEKYGDVEITDEMMKMLVSKGKKVWMPENGKDYYYFDTANLQVYCENCVLEQDDPSLLRLSAFKTREECEEYVKHLKTKAELQLWIAENDYIEDYEGLDTPYSIFPGGRDNFLIVDECDPRGCGFENFIFSSEEKAMEAIDAIGKDKIWKMLRYRRDWF